MIKKQTFVSGLMVAMMMAAGPAMAAAAPAPAAKDAPAAASSTVTGKILRVDVNNNTITLASGQFYMVPAAVKLDGLKPGDQISMSVTKDQYGIFTVDKINK